ncbi:hypothetical protein [Fimbriiglobus ruber]|uniref:hypothetical protein n=1 Tax=Fimbriiglobus ruber TaxID=1908690 RepID=UPI0013799BEE
MPFKRFRQPGQGGIQPFDDARQVRVDLGRQLAERDVSLGGRLLVRKRGLEVLVRPGEGEPFVELLAELAIRQRDQGREARAARDLQELGQEGRIVLDVGVDVLDGPLEVEREPLARQIGALGRHEVVQGLGVAARELKGLPERLDVPRTLTERLAQNRQ